MLDLAGVNLWAVALVWLVYVTIGAFWYSPAGFAKQWTKLTGIDIMKLPKKDTSVLCSSSKKTRNLNTNCSSKSLENTNKLFTFLLLPRM